MRLIDADVLAKTIEKAQMESRKVNVLSLIHDAPTIDSLDLDVHIGGRCCGKRQRLLDELRPKGKWIKSSNMSKRSYQRLCSNCKHIVYFCGDGNYPNCPYCLADMRGDV